MTNEFDHVRGAFASSLAGQGLAAMDRMLRSAWRSSTVGAAVRSIGNAMVVMPSPSLVRTIATAVVIAAAAQPILTGLMSKTVVPAMPWPVFALVAVFAAGAWWQAEAVIAAWPASRLARWFR